jgi:hypothetical protein
MRSCRLAIIVGLLGALALAPAVTAADPSVVSGRLTPITENPAADPDGAGLAVLTINAARTELTYRITYRKVDAQITAVYFCAGQNPRVVPIPITCAFAISPSAGGPSPITGSRAIEPSQADVLMSGFTVIQLDSATGPQLAGYMLMGPPPPDTATIPVIASQRSLIVVLLPLLGATVAFAFVVAASPKRSDRGDRSAGPVVVLNAGH